ncbi:hypothetical protein VKT23_006138 [Stygiomarasmius scandens]|uniref:Cytochrome P450 n=1 Tax=Marasmiellus scandens TaxID=2682957 RepID=A0ABR1JRE7_9AGAR
MSLPTEQFLIFTILACVAATIYYRQRKGLRLPPGPPGIPIVGNLFDFPEENDPFPWKEHLELYGPISSVSTFGKTVVIVNDRQTAIDLMNQRSIVYSGRPIFTFAGELISWDQQMILSQNNPHFQSMRKLLKSFIGTKSAIVAFEHLQETETRLFLLRMLRKSGELIPNIRLTAGAIALRISHGYTIDTDITKDDPLVDLIQTAAKEFYIATRPGAWMVDIFPWLKYVPDWATFVPFKRAGAIFRAHNLEQANRPLDFVKREMEQGNAYPSFTSAMLSEVSSNPQDNSEHHIKWAANSIYGGGTDPSVAALSTFFMLMILHPDIQDKARAELDKVVGTRRLPTFQDRPNLPYIEALIKELLRWHPVGRIGIPHRCVEEDVFNGYRIPKDAIILPHMWNYTRDPSTYSRPSEFRPERFLGEEPELDPNSFIFGFGRRACPGQDFANAHMFITIVLVLSVFHIKKGKDTNGNEINVKPEFNIGTVCHPKHFPYTLECRSAEAEELIRSISDSEEFKQREGGNRIAV